MKRKSIRVQLKEWGACSDGYDWAIKQKSWKALWANCPRGDWMIWLLRKTGNWTHAQKVGIAVACAEHVLHICEAKHPDGKRPRQAIEAAKAWLDNPCDATRNAAAAYSAAAYSAAYSAAAYAAAAYSAAAYSAAAYSAAAYSAAAYSAAAYSAAYSASAADAATDAADYSASAAAAAAAERLWQADAIRNIVADPWNETR
jgi:hypothetical protein